MGDREKSGHWSAEQIKLELEIRSSILAIATVVKVFKRLDYDWLKIGS